MRKFQLFVQLTLNFLCVQRKLRNVMGRQAKKILFTNYLTYGLKIIVCDEGRHKEMFFHHNRIPLFISTFRVLKKICLQHSPFWHRAYAKMRCASTYGKNCYYCRRDSALLMFVNKVSGSGRENVISIFSGFLLPRKYNIQTD